jgi:hypothetical protein
MPGKATGAIRCQLNLPAIDVDWDCRGRAFDSLRRSLRRQLPTASSALEGGSFTISAEFRAPKLGSRWRPISRWRAGQNVEAALERAASKLAAFSYENRASRG